MNLKQLRHAVCVAEEQSLGRAAEKLHITQSALSRSIQALEHSVGLSLFDRVPKGVKLTAAGALFLDRARELLRQANGLQQEAALIRGAQTGAIAMGVGPVPLHVLMPRVLPLLLADHPGLDIQLVVEPALQLLKLLLDEKLECFVAGDQQFQSQEGVDVIPLQSYEVGFYVRPGHPLLSQKGLTISDLQSYTLASPGFEKPRMQAFGEPRDALLEGHWAGHLYCEYLPVLLATTVGSDAVLLTASAAVQEESERGELILLQGVAGVKKMSTHLALVKLAGRSLSPVGELMLAGMRSLADADS